MLELIFVLWMWLTSQTINDGFDPFVGYDHNGDVCEPGEVCVVVDEGSPF